MCSRRASEKCPVLLGFLRSRDGAAEILAGPEAAAPGNLNHSLTTFA